MEIKYKKKNGKNKFRLILACSSCMILLCSITILSKIPGTYAWFETNSTAVGTIQNAKKSDLVEIQVGNINYIGQCKIKTALSIKNVSSTDIPIKIQLVNLNSKDKTVSDITLQGNSNYTTDSTMINLNKDQCSNNNIAYRVIGFNGYINEMIPIQLDFQKLQVQSASPVHNSSAEVKGASNAQPSIGDATKSIQLAPRDSGNTVNDSTLTSVDTTSNGSQSQGT